MTTPHPFDLLDDHRQDPLGSLNGVQALRAGTDPIREFERAVAARGFLGHRSGHRIVLYGPAATARFRAAALTKPWN